MKGNRLQTDPATKSARGTWRELIFTKKKRYERRTKGTKMWWDEGLCVRVCSCVSVRAVRGIEESEALRDGREKKACTGTVRINKKRREERAFVVSLLKLHFGPLPSRFQEATSAQRSAAAAYRSKRKTRTQYQNMSEKTNASTTRASAAAKLWWTRTLLCVGKRRRERRKKAEEDSGRISIQCSTRRAKEPLGGLLSLSPCLCVLYFLFFFFATKAGINPTVSAFLPPAEWNKSTKKEEREQRAHFSISGSGREKNPSPSDSGEEKILKILLSLQKNVVPYN